MAKTTSTATAFMMILMLTPAVQAGSVLYVDDDALLNGDGTSWNTAFRFLQDAITEAANGGIVELRIAQGVYRPDQSELNPEGTLDQHATFDLVQDVALVGGYAGIGAPDPDERDIELYETVLSGLLVPLQECTYPSDCCNAHKKPGCDCGTCAEIVCDIFPDCCTIEWEEMCAEVAIDLCGYELCQEPQSEHSYHVVTVFNKVATLDGLTISNGAAGWPLPEHERNGGGVFNISGDLTVIDCSFITNYADRGGGIYNLNASASIQDCEFVNHSTDFGSAIYNIGSDVNISECLFKDNTSSFRGAGIYNNTSDAIITNCQFIGNHTWGQGGTGIFNENSSPMIVNSTFEQNSVNVTYGGGGAGGGAIFNDASNPFVLNCSFVGNSAEIWDDSYYFIGGGGIFSSNDSNPIIVNCTFIENLTSGKNNSYKGSGGALASLDSNPIVIECTFLNNEALVWGGGIATSGGNAVIVGCEFIENIAAKGGAILFNQADSSTIAQCNFVLNHAYWGGAAADRDNSTSKYTNCTFFKNSAIGGGAAASWNESGSTFTNCTFSGNWVDDLEGFGGLGGALASVASPSSYMEIANCTISSNIASISGGGVFVGRAYDGQGDISTAKITNSIVWNNLDQNGNGESAQIFIDDSSPDFTASVNYSNIEGLTGNLGGIGNIGDDPLFVDPDGDDDIPGNEDDNLRLQPGSPAIDAAFNNAVPFDLADLDEDDDTNEFTPIDLDGNPRFADAPKTPDTGCGVPVIVDMGAYELLGDPIQPCLGDNDGDLIVNTSDLLILFGTWGTCDDCCLADFDANGSVNTSDLLILFANWGLCP